VKVAVVGHVEWVEFIRLERVPATGEIVHAEETWTEAAGGGAVAAGQILRLAGAATFFTALGDDDLGHRAFRELTAMGIAVEAVFRPESQRRAVTILDARGERTIIVIGDRLAPRYEDPLPWDDLAEFDAVYVTACDPKGIRAARAAHVLVATPRARVSLREAGVVLDALVGSASDRGEQVRPEDVDPPPRAIVRTEGARGGSISLPDGTARRFTASPLPAPLADTYGAGDSFAAGLTYGLGADLPLDDAVVLAARCGASALTGRGAYAGQLRLAR